MKCGYNISSRINDLSGLGQLAVFLVPVMISPVEKELNPIRQLLVTVKIRAPLLHL